MLFPAAHLSFTEHEDYTFNLRAIDVCFLSDFPLKWFYRTSGSSVLAKHSKSGAYSCFLGYPMSCSCYSVILHPLLLSGCESSFQAGIKRSDRRLRLGFYLRSLIACFHRRLSQNTKNEAHSYFLLWQFMIVFTSGSCDLQTCCEYPSNCLLFIRIVNSSPKTNHLNLIKLDVGEHCWS